MLLVVYQDMPDIENLDMESEVEDGMYMYICCLYLHMNPNDHSYNINGCTYVFM